MDEARAVLERLERIEALEASAAAPDELLGELRDHAAARLARHKLPRRIAVVAEIPRTAATRQVQRRLLVEQLS